MRYCDHVFVEIKKITAGTRIESKDIEPGKIYPSSLLGVLLVCHFCGDKKEVWENGVIIQTKKYASDSTNQSQ